MTDYNKPISKAFKQLSIILIIIIILWFMSCLTYFNLTH